MKHIWAILLWLAALGTVALCASGRWTWPHAIAAHNPALDRQFNLTWLIIGVTFAVVQVLLGFIVWRYGTTQTAVEADSVETRRSASLPAWEIAWTAGTAFIFISLAITGGRVWRDWRNAQQATSEVWRVGVWGQQYQWQFHYAGIDGQTGRTVPQLINDAGGNPIGLDRANDAAASDDLVAATLVLPLNRVSELTLHARDVIHSLWLPNLRFKQDAVPGLTVKAYLTPTQAGLYEIACAELCGPQHYNMRAQLLVLPPDEFAALMSTPRADWPAQRNALLAKYATDNPE